MGYTLQTDDLPRSGQIFTPQNFDKIKLKNIKVILLKIILGDCVSRLTYLIIGFEISHEVYGWLQGIHKIFGFRLDN